MHDRRHSKTLARFRRVALVGALGICTIGNTGCKNAAALIPGLGAMFVLLAGMGTTANATPSTPGSPGTNPTSVVKTSPGSGVKKPVVTVKKPAPSAFTGPDAKAREARYVKARKDFDAVKTRHNALATELAKHRSHKDLAVATRAADASMNALAAADRALAVAASNGTAAEISAAETAVVIARTKVSEFEAAVRKLGTAPYIGESSTTLSRLPAGR